MPGNGNNPAQIENDMVNSFPQGGVVHDIPIGLNDWVLPTGGQLAATTAAGAPYRAVVQAAPAFGFVGIRWDATVTSTGLITTVIKLPGEYDPTTDECILIASLRSLGAADQTQVMLCSAQYFQPGQIIGNAAQGAVAGTVPTDLVAGEAAITVMNSVTATAIAGTVTPSPFGLPIAAPAANFTLSRNLPQRIPGPGAGVSTGVFDVQFNLSSNTPGRNLTTTPLPSMKPLGLLALVMGVALTPTGSNTVDLFGSVLRIRRNTSINNRDRRFNRLFCR